MLMKKKINNVALIEPTIDAEFFGTILFAQIRCQFPLLRTELNSHGYNSKIFAEDLIDFSQSVVEQMASFDVAAFSVTVTTFGRTKELADELRAINPEIIVVCGGIGVKFYADYVLEFSDYVINGDGEEIFVDLLQSIEKGEAYPEIFGVGFREKGTFRLPEYHVSALQNPSDYSEIEGYEYPTPKRSIFGFYKPIRHSIFSSKGCINSCGFCPCRSPHRVRDIDHVIQDIQSILRLFKNQLFLPQVFMLVDDCPYGDMAHFKELLERIAFEVKEYNCLFETQIRASYLNDEELCRLLKKAKFYLLAVGFETTNQCSLNSQNKGTSIDDNLNAIAMMRKYRLTPYSFLIGGFPTDTLDTIAENTQFFIDQAIIGQFLPYHIFNRNPKNGLFYEAAPDKIIDEFAFGGTIYVGNIQENFLPSELQQALYDSYQEIFNLRRLVSHVNNTERFYTLIYRNLVKLWKPKIEYHIDYLRSLGL